MSEWKPDLKTPEAAVEHIPTHEEIRALIAGFAEGKEMKETRKRADEKGLYLLEVEVAGEATGETIEFAYMRKGSFKEGKAVVSTIQKTRYEDGMPSGGDTIADFVDGKWVRK